MSDGLRAYVERNLAWNAVPVVERWRWIVVDGSGGTLISSVAVTKRGARWGARRALRRARTDRSNQREEIR